MRMSVVIELFLVSATIGHNLNRKRHPRRSDNDVHREDFKFMQRRTLVEYRKGLRLLISGPRQRQSFQR